MKNMKHVLRERWYAYEDATRLYESGYRPENFYGFEVEEPELKEPEVEAEAKQAEVKEAGAQ